MKKTNWIPLLIIYLFWLPPGCGRRIAVSELKVQATLGLSEQFETVLYANTALLIDSPNHKGTAEGDLQLFRNAFSYFDVALDSLSLPAGSDALANSEAVMVGAKDFRPPKPFGTEPLSRSCYVALLKSGNSFNLARYTNNETPISIEGGIQAWKKVLQVLEVDSVDAGPSGSELYVAQIGGSYLLVTEELQELEKLARRLKRFSTGEPAVISETSEWPKLLPSEMWGYRGYYTNNSSTDPSGGFYNVPKNAKSLTFYYDKQSKALVLRLTVDEPADDVAIAKMYTSNHLPLPKPIGANKRELVIPLSGNLESIGAMSSVRTLYGFGIFVMENKLGY